MTYFFINFMSVKKINDRCAINYVKSEMELYIVLNTKNNLSDSI